MVLGHFGLIYGPPNLIKYRFLGKFRPYITIHIFKNYFVTMFSTISFQYFSIKNSIQIHPISFTCYLSTIYPETSHALDSKNMGDVVCVWIQIKKPTYFTIHVIFVIIYEPIILFSTIYGAHCTILTNFYFYLQYFQQKVFSFNKISGPQTDP